MIQFPKELDEMESKLRGMELSGISVSRCSRRCSFLFVILWLFMSKKSSLLIMQDYLSLFNAG